MIKYISFQNTAKFESKELEPFHELNKQKTLSDSVCLDSLRLELSTFKKSLIDIIYMINQGIQLNDSEKQLIFFRITKLFQYSDIELKRLNYRVIQIIKLENLDYIILQSLKNDLTSNNEYLKSMAFSSLKYLKNKTMILQLERFIQQGMGDVNQNISVKAIIAALQMSQFSNKYWEDSLENMILNQSPIKNCHAIVLLCQLKQSDIIRFTSFLIRLIKNPLSSILNMQIIRFIKAIILKIDSYHQNLFIDYLLLQIDQNDPLVVLEACKIISSFQNIDNIIFKPFITKIFSFLHCKCSNIQVFSAQQLLIKILSNPKIKHQITKERVGAIQNHIANYRSHISSRAHYLYTYLQEDQQNLAICFSSTYYQTNLFKFKLNFFTGLYEFIIENPIYGQQVIEFMHLVFDTYTKQQLLNEAIKILSYLYICQKNQRQLIISTLLWIADLSDILNKFKVVVFINKFVNNISFDKIKMGEVVQQLNHIKLQFQQTDFSMSKETIGEQVNIQYYWEYIEWISHIIYQ